MIKIIKKNIFCKVLYNIKNSIIFFINEIKKIVWLPLKLLIKDNIYVLLFVLTLLIYFFIVDIFLNYFFKLFK